MVKMLTKNFDSSNLGELVNKLILQIQEKDKLIHSLQTENENLKATISNFETQEDQIVEYENWLQTDEADELANAYEEAMTSFNKNSTDYSGFENNTYKEV